VDADRVAWKAAAMDEQDLRLRNTTYGLFVGLGRAPRADEVAAELDLNRTDVLAAWRRLHEEHALVLHVRGEELLMANPFSAVPTAYRVRAGGRSWYANCAWDAFGICAALDSNGVIDTRCADCGESMSVAVKDRRPDDEGLLFHCLVPAAAWWNDIVFT
jgi:hypothetical protein